MTADRPMIGIAMMLGFCIIAPLADATAKLLGDRVPLLQILVIRFGLQVVLLTPFVVAVWSRTSMSRRVWFLTFARTVLHIVGIGLMVMSLRFLPLADAVAIAFVMPFILLLLGRIFLKEEVGTRRLAAVILGFSGTLMVVQPSFAEVGAPALLPFGVALIFALFMLVTRAMAKQADPIGMQWISGIMAMVILLPIFAVADGSLWVEVNRVRPSPPDWLLLLAMGGLGTFGHLLMTWSLRFAPASTLAPMQYLEIPGAALVGYFVFRDFPNGLALIGICVTISAGLYIIFRERALNQQQSPPSPVPAP